MRTVVETLLVFFLVATTTWTLCQAHNYKQEARSIMKRLARGGRIFDDHDVARIHLVEGEGQSVRRLVKRDLKAMGSNTNSEDRNEIMHLLQLQLASGSKVNLSLTPADIVDHDTVVAHHRSRGRTEGRLSKADCYSYGRVEDSSGKGGVASVSRCDGLFGYANSRRFEYFLHPVESRRSKSKRDVGEGEDYDVHVMWRRSVADDAYDSSNATHDSSNATHDFVDYFIVEDEEEESHEPMGFTAAKAVHQNETGFVVEMALTSDSEYCQTLHYLYPGREDDYLLTKLAGVQALFSNREKMGYDVKIKVKLLDYWETDPENYTFTQDLGKNLKSFCRYTTKKYAYDVHALNTGVDSWNDGVTGIAYVSGACTGSRCLIVKEHDLDSFQGFAHELGHSLGMSHTSDCSDALKAEAGGFMGGGARLNFSPCMQHQLGKFIKSSRSNCLFKTSQTTAAEEFSRLGSMYPGQIKSPDEMCQLLAGPDYRYMSNHRDPGGKVCQWFMCLDENEKSPEYHRVRHFTAPSGFPCREESYCDQDKCKFWNQTKMALEIDTLRNLTEIPEWSEWSTDFSPCTRSCGAGIRTRRRVCQYSGYNLAPYCPGVHLDPELCNAQPCPGVEETTSEVRKAMGHEMCSGFLAHHVHLKLKKADAYLPDSAKVTTNDVGQSLKIFESNSCLLKCIREPKDAKGEVDAIMPDGTPCLENTRSDYQLNRLNSSMKCIGGYCVEVSDCPNILQVKDDCGICGGSDRGCVELTFNSSYNVPRTERALLMNVPAFSRNVDVHANLDKNEGIVIELWSSDDRNIIGDGGQYERGDYQAVPFAGTFWTYDSRESFFRADGPLNESVQVKFLRLGPPLHNIIAHYLEHEEP